MHDAYTSKTKAIIIISNSPHLTKKKRTAYAYETFD